MARGLVDSPVRTVAKVDDDVVLDVDALYRFLQDAQPLVDDEFVCRVRRNVRVHWNDNYKWHV